MTNLCKIIHKPLYFYNFQTNNWDHNQKQLEENDLVLYLEELSEKMIPVSAATAITESAITAITAITATAIAAMAIATRRRYFWNNFDNLISEKKKIEYCKQEFYVYLTKDNKRTIIWKEFLEKI